MNAYIYRAALYCPGCTGEIEARLVQSAGKRSGGKVQGTYIDTGDSDDYPQGPYADGGGEADSPQHCDACNGFLENPLTSDGYAYLSELFADGERVRAALHQAEQSGQGAVQRAILDAHAQYRAFYGVE